MSESCGWPKGVCACHEKKLSKPDPWGRVWMHSETGLTYSKASMSRFMMFCLGNNIEIGDVHAFNPNYKNSSVIASVRIKPDQIDAFENETGGKLRQPPKIILN